MRRHKLFFLDGGNSHLKSRSPDAAGRNEEAIPHRFVRISESDYQRATVRGNPDEDYFIINGIPYVVGEKARRYGRFDRKFGESRYNDTYYGVLSAMAMARMFQKTTRNIFFVGSHPPKDVDYADDLMASVVKDWHVIWKGQEIKLTVVNAATVDEPVAGWANLILRKDGRAYARSELKDSTSLVLDVGGFTSDGVAIDPGGAIDYNSARSETVGVLEAVEQFAKDFRTQNAKLVKGIELDTTKIHEALRYGVFDLRGLGKHDCQSLAHEVCRSLVDSVIDFYESFGGAASYDNIILTGGGSALLYDYLKDYIRHNSILLADDRERLQFANVRGIEKWTNLQIAIGTYNL